MSELWTVGLQEAEKSTKNKVETVLLDTLYIDNFIKCYKATELGNKEGNSLFNGIFLCEDEFCPHHHCILVWNEDD